ncbi:MAG: SAM-dependent methyltransferase [Chlorobi bacterium]|nr:SAM-dependent methyltransferase [Chlorobiota bacterium]
MSEPTLYVIPTPIGGTVENSLTPEGIEIVKSLRYFVVENQRQAWKFLSQIFPVEQRSQIVISQMPRNIFNIDVRPFLVPLREGHSLGLLSDAGYPTILDPGYPIVRQAHREDFPVKVLIGPSSVFLALAGSGLNGQNFTVHGYIPQRNIRQWLLRIESISRKYNQSQIFMETPYRTPQTFRLMVKTLHPNTQICVAQALTTPNEFLYTAPVRWWYKNVDQVLKYPTIFIIQA